MTVVDVEGSSPRPVGSQIAVSDEGLWVGQLTSGCAEAAIVSEAMDTIRTQQQRLVRYGRGSRYIDIQLPCGSGLDLYFDPLVPDVILEDLTAALENRKPAVWTFETDPGRPQSYKLMTNEKLANDHIQEFGKTGRSASGTFRRTYLPPIRLDVVGRGTLFVALAKIANYLDWQIVASSPERATLAIIEEDAAITHHISCPGDYSADAIDPRTASVLLFHDHEWEPHILDKVLQKNGFYVGALGSRKAHVIRCAALRELGHTSTATDRISGPIGLDIGARTPPEIAIAIISEILTRDPSQSLIEPIPAKLSETL